MNRIAETRVQVLVPLAAAVNGAVGYLVGNYPLPVPVPLYLDSLGTVLAGLLAGPLAGALTGVLANLVLAIVNQPSWALFALPAAIIGVLAGVAGDRGLVRLRAPLGLAAALAVGLGVGLVAAALSAPIAAYVFGGTTGAIGPDALVVYFRALGHDVLRASFYQSLLSDSVDKVLTFGLVWAALGALSPRLVRRYPNGARLLGEPLDAPPGA